MAKKNKAGKGKNKEFSSNPFSDLKGLSVSEPQEHKPATPKPAEKRAESGRGSFAGEMELLGVKRLHPADSGDEQPADQFSEPVAGDAEKPSEEEIFLRAMGELQVDFRDNLPQEEAQPKTSARRMKQLKQGKLVPEATLDLHGLTKADIACKLTFFLQDAEYQGWQTVLVITGKGLHSADGEPILRVEAERYLYNEGRKWVAEWGRAPKKYGGEGALVLFLRKSRN